MKFLEEKISLLENENLTLKMLVEAATTATTTPSVSTMKGTKEYRSSMNVDQPIMRPPSFGGAGSGGGEPPPPPPTTTFSEFVRQLQGTSTKDIASLSGSKYIPYR